MTTNNTNPTKAPDAVDDELNSMLWSLNPEQVDATVEEVEQAICTKYIPISQDQLQKFEIAHHDALKGVDDYQKFKNSKDEFERMAAWINQLSPWNLQNGVDALRAKYVSREESWTDSLKDVSSELEQTLNILVADLPDSEKVEVATKYVLNRARQVRRELKIGDTNDQIN